MIVLLALSIVAIYLFASRWRAIRRAINIDDNFMKDVNDYLLEGKVRSAKALCKRFDSPVSRMVYKGIVRMESPLEDIRSAMENVGNLEVARLEKGLPFLAAIAGGAPMIGFLGTVIGMVQAFFNMSLAGGNVDISILSGGIYTAMITTVGGLIVGILAYFGYNFLTARISALVLKMETGTGELLETILSLRDRAEGKEEAR